MILRSIAFCALILGYFIFAGGSARADDTFCSVMVRYLTPDHAGAAPDTTYYVLLANIGEAEVTHARIALFGGKDVYELDVPVEGATPVESELFGSETQYRPLEIHFSKPTSIRAAWLESIGDERGNAATCLANPAVTRDVDKHDPTKQDTQFDTRARTNPRLLDVAPDAALEFITPETCSKEYEDASVANQLLAEYPSRAAETGTGSVVALVVVGLRADGTLAFARMGKSSGSEALDRAAITAARQSTYRPRKLDCVPYAGIFRMRTEFDPGN